MNDQEWVRFLQWALPRMRMYWPGFRKVRKNIIKRIHKRIQVLQLADTTAYQHYLEGHPEEWTILDGLCRVTISRFYRDKMVFAVLEKEILTAQAQQIMECGEDTLRVWSAGCASGEEPYSLSILWILRLHTLFPELAIAILATDADPTLLQRAESACYPFSSVKNLSSEWRKMAFTQTDDSYCLHPEYKRHVTLLQHDIRDPVPDGPFQLILCRNLVFTYFEHELQCELAQHLRESLADGGVLLLGVHERLPEGISGFVARNQRLGIYQKQ
jgi:chemotaxis protein methyltransferase CheR